MTRTLIICPLCPCRFLTKADLNHRMSGSTDDPAVHIRRYVSNIANPKKLKSRRGLELYDEYLMKRGIKPRPRTKRPKGEIPSLDQRLARYAGKIKLFQLNYCGSSSTVNRLPCRPSLSGSWLVRKMEEEL